MPNTKSSEYVKLIARISKTFSQADLLSKPFGERWQRFKDIVDDLLTSAVANCTPKTIYSVHTVSERKIRYEWSGPRHEEGIREGWQDIDISRGCIGEALLGGLSFLNVPNTRASKTFMPATKEFTKSELVTILPSPRGIRHYRVFNFECNVINAFSDTDIMALSLLAKEVAVQWDYLAQSQGELSLISDLTDSLAANLPLGEKHRSYEASSPLPLSIVKLFQAYLPFDAVAVTTTMPLKFAYAFTLDYYFDQDLNRLKEHSFAASKSSGSYELVTLDEGEVLSIENENSRRIEEVQVFRPATSSALGVTMPGSKSVSTKKSALLFEFNAAEKFSAHDKRLVAGLGKLFASISGLTNRLKNFETLSRVADLLPKLDILSVPLLGSSQGGDTPISRTVLSLINNTLGAAVEALQSSGCAIYEIVGTRPGGVRLQKLGLYQKLGEGSLPDIPMRKTIRENWLAIEEGISNGPYEFSMSVSLEEASGGEILFSNRPLAGEVYGESPFNNREQEVERSTATKRYYRVYCENLKIIGCNTIFASFKAVSEQRAHLLRMSSSSRAVLDVILKVLRLALEGMEAGSKSRSGAMGLTTAIRMALKPPRNAVLGAEKSREELYAKAHQFLAKAVPVSEKHTAIFRLASGGEELVITDTSYEILLKEARDKHGVETELPKLAIPLVGESPESGLTTRVFSSRASVFSLTIDDDGSESCKIFWQVVTGAVAGRRYFAGAPIRGPGKEVVGVLTLNGIAPPHAKTQIFEMRWKLMPLLIDVADELGRQLGLLRSRRPRTGVKSSKGRGKK